MNIRNVAHSKANYLIQLISLRSIKLNERIDWNYTVYVLNAFLMEKCQMMYFNSVNKHTINQHAGFSLQPTALQIEKACSHIFFLLWNLVFNTAVVYLSLKLCVLKQPDDRQLNWFHCYRRIIEKSLDFEQNKEEKKMMASSKQNSEFLLAVVHEFLSRKDRNLASVFKSKCSSVRHTWLIEYEIAMQSTQISNDINFIFSATLAKGFTETWRYRWILCKKFK